MMFTKDQGQELIDNTTSGWTMVNGVNGRKFTSKTDSSKYIFLPAGGYWKDTTLISARSVGSYWAIEIVIDENIRAWALSFNSTVAYGNSYVDWRKYGFPIRSIRPLEW